MRNFIKKLLWRVYASVYDTVTTSYPYREMMQQVAESIPKGSRVLDIGCGTGGLMEYLDNVEEYIGIDTEPAMLERARMRAQALAQANPARGAKRTQFIQGSVFDTREWPVVNIAVFCNSLYTLEDKEGALRAAHRIVTQAGRLVICDPDGVPDIRKVLSQHFASYAAERGLWAMRAHKLCVFPKLALIAVINQLIFDAYPFTRYSHLALLLQKSGFAVGFHKCTYAGQNLLLLALKRS